MGELTLDIKGSIAEVTLNRPERKNALSENLFDALAETGEHLKSQTGLRAVILSGAGGDFCAGLDLSVMQSFGARLDEMRTRLLNPPTGEAANWFQKPCYVWQELQVPVIAAINGFCLGGGLQLALAADFRICHPDARLSIMESKWGLIPDMGISQNLPKLMSADRAKLLMMTARMLSGAEARSDGLVTELAEDPLSAARDLARELSAQSPDAVNGVKQLVAEVWHLPPGDGLAREAAIQAPIIGAANQMEAVVAKLQKRAAIFKS